MSEFTYLYRGRETAASPEQMQRTMEKWVAWFKELGAKGHIKDPGHPLEHTGKVVKGKQKIINDLRNGADLPIASVAGADLETWWFVDRAAVANEG